MSAERAPAAMTISTVGRGFMRFLHSLASVLFGRFLSRKANWKKGRLVRDLHSKSRSSEPLQMSRRVLYPVICRSEPRSFVDAHEPGEPEIRSERTVSWHRLSAAMTMASTPEGQ